MSTMDFGDAIKALKAGKRIAREGWNGKGMWLCMGEGRRVTPEQLWNVHTNRFAVEKAARALTSDGVTTQVCPYIVMKTAADEIQMGWNVSQADMLAEDWTVLD